MTTLEEPAATTRQRESRPASRPWLAAGLVAIALGLAVVALLGPLLGDLVDYRLTETFRNQTVGLDVLGLAYAALAVAVFLPVFRPERRTTRHAAAARAPQPRP